jgi:hypothetical protein
VVIKLNEESKRGMLLIIAVPGGTRKCFVRDSDTQGTEG